MPSLGTWRNHAGFATEVTYGTTVAAATIYLPFNTWDDYTDDQGIVLDNAMRAVPSNVLGAYAGMKQGKWGATFPYFPNEAARFWPKLMGTDTVVSSSNGGWQHLFTMNSSANPNSDTVFLFFGSTYSERQFVGTAYTGLDFKFSRASGMATAKITAVSAAPSSGVAEQVPSYTSNPPLRGWQAVFSIAGSTRTTLQELELNLSREAELVFAGNNSQRPSAVEYGALDAKGKMKLYGSTEEPYIDYQALTQQNIDLQLVDTAPGSTVNRLGLTMSKVVFTKVTPNMSGKYLAYEIEFQAVHNSSAGGDSGPIQVTTTILSSAASTA